MIKILTGYSDRGGSTTALSRLTNTLNDNGYVTTMYGPHQHHTTLCDGEQLTNDVIDNISGDDVVLVHFLKLDKRPNAKKVVLVCHEKDLFEVGKIKQFWDSVVFLNERHRKYHKKYKGDFTIIPNLAETMVKRDKPELDKVAGIIGSIDFNKQTHKSIGRALKDGCKPIYVFGEPKGAYFESHVKPLCSGNVEFKGFSEDKQAMYDSIGRVYHSSLSEVACLVKDECMSTGTQFFGNEATDTKLESITNDEVITRWVETLELGGIEPKTKPIVHAFFVCYNEEGILPHLLRYYSTFCEKIIIMDNNSTDSSVEIVNSFPNTEVIPFESNEEFHDGIHIQLKNEVWKSSIGVADFVILGDTDEFLYHEDMEKFLIDSKARGMTVFRPEGYHMIADEELVLLADDNVLDRIKNGVRTPVLDKPMMFDCNKIKEINYNFGCHSATPTGDVRWSTTNDLKMLHFKFVGIEDYLYKNKIRAERLSKFNRDNGFGTYYLVSEEEFRLDYKSYLDKRTKVLD